MRTTLLLGGDEGEKVCNVQPNPTEPIKLLLCRQIGYLAPYLRLVAVITVCEDDDLRESTAPFLETPGVGTTMYRTIALFRPALTNFPPIYVLTTSACNPSLC